MVSRRQITIVLVVISLGLIGPIGFIAQNAAKNTTSYEASPTPVPTPVRLSQVLEYTADVTAEIIQVQPLLITIIDSELNQSALQGTLSNFTNATLYSLDYSGDYYSASFILNETADANLLLPQFEEAQAEIVEFAFPAEIELPASFTAYRGSTPTEMSVGPMDTVEAIVYGRTFSGPANFTLKITKSGNVKRVVAFEKP